MGQKGFSAVGSLFSDRLLAIPACAGMTLTIAIRSGPFFYLPPSLPVYQMDEVNEYTAQ